MTTAKCIVSKTYQGFVAKLHIPDDSGTQERPTKTVVLPTPILVVDTSGSMGHHAARLIRKLLPDTLERLKYPGNTSVHLITFESSTRYVKLTCDELRKFGSFVQGSTNMGEVPKYLKDILKTSSHGYLILTVSDGGIWDQERTQLAAAKLASTVQSLAAPISSHAIRFGTGGEADTRALSAILQLDNSGLEVSVKDIQSSWTDDTVIEGLISAVSRDGNVSLSSVSLTVENASVRRFPWDASGGNSIPLNRNDEVFWLDSVPTVMTVDGNDVAIECNDTFLDRAAYQQTLGKYLDGIMQRARLLKVVGTDDTRGQLTQMLAYFENLESMWSASEDAVNEKEEDRDLPRLLLRSRRLRRNLTKSTQSLRHRLNAILNDDKVSNMNSSQQADYLRTVDTSKNAKGLAKRGAASQGAFDFDTETRREVRAMQAHLAELADVDDRNHMVSFYSRGTTLDGIKTVCELVDDGTLDAASTAQIIELFNVVGFPCDAPIGDFPDPMTYRINEVFPHCQVSLADVLVYAVDSQGQDLKTPATDRKITNVVPVFEDARIATFLRKYAPTLLEYVASVGMRRIIVDVPKTMAYTMLAGVWKMMETLGDTREGPVSEVAIRTFLYMLDQLPTTVGRAFAHTLPLLSHPNDDEKTAYHLMHNGVTNMLVALLHGIREKEDFDIAKLLRALYSFEVWQAVRKQYRTTDGECDRMKNKLFNVDFDKWRVPVTPLFSADTSPEDVPATWPAEISDSYTEKVLKCCWYADVITYIPDMFGTATVKDESIGEKVDKFKQLEPLTDERKAQTLSVPDWTKFRNAVLLQALTYTTKKSRVHENTELPLLPDPGCESETKKLSDTVLRDIYLSQYKSDLAKKTAEEDAILIDELVTTLLGTTDIAKFAQLVTDGVTRGTRTLTMNNASSAAFQTLYSRLFTATPETTIPAHGEKLAFIIAGVTQDGQQKWNNGNLLLPFRKWWFAIFEAIKREDLWSYLRKLQRERVHRYREGKANRHSHSNDKVSYWAMGYATMDQMRNEVDEATWKEYLLVHSDCCGCAKGDYLGAL